MYLLVRVSISLSMIPTSLNQPSRLFGSDVAAVYTYIINYDHELINKFKNMCNKDHKAVDKFLNNVNL